MIQFILNDKLVKADQRSGSTMLDYVRYYKRLVGTKIGCREGDCGACTILVGDFENDKLVYRSMTSCLMPLGNAHGKHIVSVEGINLPAGRQGMEALSPVQQAMVDTNGTQCGFCTIGFVMSLTGFVLNDTAKEYDKAVAAIDGNICRCTGYKSIERAAAIISDKINDKPEQETITWLVEQKFIPAYFLQIKKRLTELRQTLQQPDEVSLADKVMLGGGTDLVVQKALAVKKSDVVHLFDDNALQQIKFENGKCHIGAGTTVTAFAESEIIQGFFPDLKKYIKLISSTPIRNMATMAGNLVNASPIGDMSIFFLALDSELLLNRNGVKRTIKLKDFYKAYKQIDKAADEFIEEIIFTPPQNKNFSFEKVCKRTHLDIASVNSACQIQVSPDGTITDIHLSAGGVAPFPKYLQDTCAFLKGTKINADNLKEAIKIMNAEVAPISDARGTAEYKRLLLRQLFLAHFKIEEHVFKQVLQV
jgi:xanthine dehydrogenase small subunit